MSDEWQAIKNLLQRYLPGKVLDLGAGRGISSYAFAKHGCTVTALEPDPSPLVGAQAIQALADTTHVPIQIVKEYGETLPFNDNSFDIVYGRAVLHHARDLNKLCLEAARVLKPGGVFLATREHVISRRVDLQAFLDSHPLHRLYGGENAFLLKEYMDAIEGAGLAAKKVIGPMESPINYAPMSPLEFKTTVNSLLAGRIGNRVANWLAGKKIVQHFCGWYLSQNMNTPGRLYSFMAVKK